MYIYIYMYQKIRSVIKKILKDDDDDIEITILLYLDYDLKEENDENKMEGVGTRLDSIRFWNQDDPTLFNTDQHQFEENLYDNQCKNPYIDGNQDEYQIGIQKEDNAEI